MRQATLFLNPNEKVWRLSEVDLVRPPEYQWHRYQFIIVNRDGELAEHCTDLGPANHDLAPIFFPVAWEHSVAEVQEIAAQSRQPDPYWKNRMKELQGESTLIKDYLDQLEERWDIIHNKSSFGPLVSHQRNGFSQEAVHGNS